MPMPAANDSVESKLDAFTAAYMQAMNAPGMTQALTTETATIRTACYGFSNVDLKAPVTPEQLFQIGSITKSFNALIMLQLLDEGKVDLHRPVIEYLPWLPVTMTLWTDHRASSVDAYLRIARCLRDLSKRSRRFAMCRVMRLGIISTTAISASRFSARSSRSLTEGPGTNVCRRGFSRPWE